MLSDNSKGLPDSVSRITRRTVSNLTASIYTINHYTHLEEYSTLLLKENDVEIIKALWYKYQNTALARMSGNKSKRLRQIG